MEPGHVPLTGDKKRLLALLKVSKEPWAKDMIKEMRDEEVEKKRLERENEELAQTIEKRKR